LCASSALSRCHRRLPSWARSRWSGTAPTTSPNMVSP
jgi:hypothetical protein